MRYFIAALLLLISIICSAAIYMQTDKNGNVTYSDMPSPGAERLDVVTPPPTQTSAAGGNIGNQPPAGGGKNAKATATPAPAEEHVAYTDFAITSPTNEQTFQNQREIPVDIQVSPALQKGDGVAILLDGVSVGDAVESTHFTLHQVNRGTHQVSAKLFSKQQTVLKEAPAVIFYVHYAALGGAS